MIQIVFYFLGFSILLSGILLLLSKHLIHTLFLSAIILLSIAGIYILLHADFIAMIQIIISVGGTLILIIFGMMLTTHLPYQHNIKKNTILNWGLFPLLAGILTYIFLSINWNAIDWIKTNPIHKNESLKNTTLLIGTTLIANYALLVELIGILLLMATVGALAIMYSKKNKSPL